MIIIDLRSQIDELTMKLNNLESELVQLRVQNDQLRISNTQQQYNNRSTQYSRTSQGKQFFSPNDRNIYQPFRTQTDTRPTNKTQSNKFHWDQDLPDNVSALQKISDFSFLIHFLYLYETFFCN